MAHPLDQSALAHLTDLAFASVQRGTDESDCYGVLTEALIEHRVALGGRPFIIFPQLRLAWEPRRARDRRANIPDIGLGRLLPNGNRHLQGGAELKAAIEVMQNFPTAADIFDHPRLREDIHRAKLQASDQVKAAIKNGSLPHNVPIKWILAVGPYFCIQHFGPFDEDHLTTRSLPPNDSGDAAIAAFLEALNATAGTRRLTVPLYRIGTPEAASAMHEYLSSQEAMTLYSSVD